MMTQAMLDAIAGLPSAYIGPGLGAGALGVILGLLASIGLAILAIFYYPIKKLIKRTKKTDTAESTDESAPDDAS